MTTMMTIIKFSLHKSHILLLTFAVLPLIVSSFTTIQTSPTRTSVFSSSTMTTSDALTSTTTLGSDSLRKLVQSAARATAESNSLDLSGIVWLEHLNLVVGSMSDAKKFYVDFLGLTPDAGNAKHFNLGQQQFHLAANEDPPQRVTGSIGLTVPSLERIRERAQTARSALEGTQFSIYENHSDDATKSKTMTVTCPWGNIFHLYDISIDDDVDSATLNSDNNANESSQKMVKFHAEGGTYGPHRMAVRGGPGIRYVEIACPVGSIDAIAKFYEEILGCNIMKSVQDGNDAVIVTVGPGVHMAFVANPDLTDEALDQMNGVHACIYISEFQSMYNTLKARDLIWTNPRFTHLDSCDTWEEACGSRTFRFKDIVDMNTGAKVLEFEHETRPMMHGQYLKVPHYVPN
mmetsp:Transcript_14194/g.30105  ORF Transcript_14194/g.30105 Transcript_14194/m.30105 type:complete len:404 (-) Transcript_14194:27-1238(-)